MRFLKAILNRVAIALGYSPREVIRILLSIAFFFSSVLACGRWWQWKHSLVPLYSPIFWTTVALAILLLAPNWRWVLIGALGILGLYGLKTALFTGEPLYLLIAVAAVGLALITYRLTPSSKSSEYLEPTNNDRDRTTTRR